MRPTYHVMISGGVTLVFALWVKSTGALVACFLSGIFIDLDHHLDYYLAQKELPLNFKKLVDFCRDDQQSKLHLFLHSYELLFLLWFSIYYFSLETVWLGIAVGFTMHIICDEIANPMRPLSYFLTYRIKHNFSRKMLFKKGYYDEIS